MVEEINTGSNDSPDGVETETKAEQIKVGDHTVDIVKGEDGKVKMVVPPELAEDESFKKDAKEVISGIVAFNKKNYDLNRKLEEIEKREQALAQQEEQKDITQILNDIEDPGYEEFLKKELAGRDRADLQDDEPGEWEKVKASASRKYHKEIARREIAREQLSTELQSFKDRGGSVPALRAYAQTLNAPITKNLIQVFEKQNTSKPTKQFESDYISSIQDDSIEIVPRSGEAAKLGQEELIIQGIINAGKSADL